MKQLLVITCILFLSFTVRAQDHGTFSLNAYGSYTFQDKVNADHFHFYVNDGFQYGGGLEYFTRENKSIEFKYLRMDTHFPLYNDLRPEDPQANLNQDKGAINYFLLGGNTYFTNHRSDAKIVPFGGLSLGLGYISGDAANTSARFAWDAKLGVKIKTSSTISLKFNAYVQSIVSAYWDDYYGVGYPYAASYPEYITVFQFGLGGAICFDFGNR